MMKFATTSLVVSTATLGLMLGAAQNAQASGLIRNIQSVTVVGGTTASGSSINNIINGSGLPGNIPSLTGVHAATTSSNAWRSNTGSTNFTITFAFNHNFDKLAGFSFWTANGTGLTPNEGVRNMTVQYSTNNGASYTTIAGTPAEFTRGSNTPQVVNFSTAFRDVTHVRFNITKNWGSSRVAIGEVQFRSIPEPSASLALLTLGLGGMVVGLRKRV